MAKLTTYEDVLAEKTVPAVAIDHNSLITMVNTAFKKAYGWSEKELMGKISYRNNTALFA